MEKIYGFRNDHEPDMNCVGTYKQIRNYIENNFEANFEQLKDIEDVTWFTEIENPDEMFETGEEFKDLREDKTTKTYDVQFNDAYHGNSKGFKESLQYCKDYIKAHNGTDWSYFADYKGGTVSVVCNETGEEVYSEPVKQ